jgi:ubiquinone biosynthesis monooxygenase Coq6
MPLTKHLRVAIIDSNPALKSRGYLDKNSIPDSRVSTVTPATISFFKGMILNQIRVSSYLIPAVFHPATVFGFKFVLCV